MRNVSYSREDFEEWLTKAKITRPIDRIFMHHFASPSAKQWRGIQTLQGVRNYHMREFDTYDIGYHFIVGPDGTIWIGRDINRIGAHAGSGNNVGSVGIAWAANFDAEDPEDYKFMYDTGIWVASQVARKCSVKTAKILGHREGINVHKSCPGKLIDVTKMRRDVQKELDTNEHVHLFIDGYEVMGANAHIVNGKLVLNSRAADRFFGWKTDWATRDVPIRDYLISKGIDITTVTMDVNKTEAYLTTDHEGKGH